MENSNTKELVSIVIPCYNSEKSIGLLVEQIVNLFNNNRDYTYEIILVNDYSKDNTWAVIKELACSNSNIIGISFSKNFGQNSAIMAGYRESQGEYVVVMDDDGENNPEHILLLLERIKKTNADSVSAEYLTETRSSFRKMGTMLNGKMAESLLNKPKGLYLNTFSVKRRYIVDEMIRYEQPFPYTAGLLLRTTTNIETVMLERGKRLYGSSGYTLKKLINVWVNGFTAFSVKPLRIAFFIGLFLFCISILSLVALIVLSISLNGLDLKLWIVLSSLGLLNGIMFCALGIIGEYIGRIYMCINNSPQYVIKDTIKKKETDYEK